MKNGRKTREKHTVSRVTEYKRLTRRALLASATAICCFDLLLIPKNYTADIFNVLLIL